MKGQNEKHVGHNTFIAPESTICNMADEKNRSIIYNNNVIETFKGMLSVMYMPSTCFSKIK